MKFLRTIRFDDSDEQVFRSAADPDEWAVSGGFAFSSLGSDDVKGKVRQEFSNGFLGLGSFGRSTFTTVSEIDEDSLNGAIDSLAGHLVDAYGAPDTDTARPVAMEEVDFIQELCENALINTVFTVRRYFDEKGEIREEFRTIQAPSDRPLHSKIWAVVDDED